MKFTNRWALPGLGTVYQVEDHGFEQYAGQPMFSYNRVVRDPDGSIESESLDHNGLPKVGEFHVSLDRALIALVAEKYTGPRGAGGPGVGTAADWFARMIGMDQWVPISYEDHKKVLREVFVATSQEDGPVPVYSRVRAMVAQLEARGLTIAAKKDS